MKKFVGKLEDLINIRSTSYDGKVRYYCPYCDSIHGKEKDEEGCLVFNKKTLTGYCFRCQTIVTHDGLKDLEYIKSCILKQEQDFNKKSNLLKIDWLTPIEENKEALEYMHNRFITTETLKTFNILASDNPLGVFFINKVIDDTYTDFMQGRFINNPTQKHAFIKESHKKLCWLHHAKNNNLIVCEGYTDGLSAYQYSKNLGKIIYPIILGGKSITESQLHELKEFCTQHKEINIWVAMDGGFFEDTLKIANKIYQSCFNTKIRVVHMPYGKDLNEINTKLFKERINSSLEFEPSKIQYIRDKVYNV